MPKLNTLVFILVGAASCLSLSACLTREVTCQAIKTAEAACVTIEMIDPDGSTRRVSVTPGELHNFARVVSIRRNAEKTSGMPLGAMTPKPEAAPDAGSN